MERRRPAADGADSARRVPHRDRRRPSGRDDCGDDDNNNNSANNSVGPNNNSVSFNSTTALVDELEQLRTDNFQLRLRVYNAERRVDGLLSASQSRGRKKGRGGSDDEAGSSCSMGTTTSNTSDEEDEALVEAGHARAAAAAKATAEAAVRTIHDLLTVNRRLLALLAATVSAKAVAVTANDKRRWRLLRDRIDDCSMGLQVLKTCL